MAFGIKVGALWKKKDKNGTTFLTGPIDIPLEDVKRLTTTEGLKLSIFVGKNRYKTEDKHPDYIMTEMLPREEKEDIPF